MPNIPNLPGVPPLSSYIPNVVSLIVLDALSVLLPGLGPPWGIFRNFLPVVAPDSFISFDFKRDCPISDYPVEDGGFQAYDKVQLPGDIRVRICKGGTVIERQLFLLSVQQQMNTTDLYDVVTPEQVYFSYNFTHMDIARNAEHGVGLITLDIWLTEVRVTASASFLNTLPQNQNAQATGNQQAIAPTNSSSTSLPAPQGFQ